MGQRGESLIERHLVARPRGQSLLHTGLLASLVSLITRHWDDKCTLAVLFHLARDEILQLLLNYDRWRVALVAPELELLAGG